MLRFIPPVLALLMAAFVAWRGLTPPAPPPPPPPPAPAEAPPPAPEAAPPLPEVTLRSAPVHEAPADAPPRGGDRQVSAEVAAGPVAPPPSIPAQLSGQAVVTGPITFRLGSTPVLLYGVKTASGASCRFGADNACDRAAQQALAMAIGRNDVSCQVPQSRPGRIIAVATCRNAAGEDLALRLVRDGLVLADPVQSYSYVSAEAAARADRRGLWGFR